MQGINWADLFSAMDKFLVALAGQYGGWVYFTLFCIFFSETGGGDRCDEHLGADAGDFCRSRAREHR